MKKIYGVVALVATLMGATLLLERTIKVAAAAAPTGIKNVVLVHGAFADGSGWEAVAKILEKDGTRCAVAQPPETSYAEDVKSAKAAVDAMNGPVVIVGHSYGGSIITEAGNDPKVSALVYIAAFALDDGESCASIEQALPQASKAFKPDSNGNWWIEQEHFAADFAADISPAESTTWLFRRCRSPPTRSPTRSRRPPGSPSPLGTWWRPQTGRSIRTRSA